MEFPMMDPVNVYREMTRKFGGYNHRLSCEEGQFFDMENMTSDYYPILSPRTERAIVKQFYNPQGILDKEELMWVDNGILYKDGEEVKLEGVKLSDTGEKTMAKMGAFVVILPDKVWYNADDGTCGYMESTFTVAKGTEITFKMSNQKGEIITWHDSAWYESNPKHDGDYMMTEANGKASLKIWSETLKMWNTVTTTYVQIGAKGIGKAFKKEDGVKITIDNSEAKWANAGNIFVNTEDDGRLSTNTQIYNLTDDVITIIGIIKENKTFTNLPTVVERKTPDMAFITECNNRLWGCSEDGHEIFCCKLGDVKNWNSFTGISTDAWRATIGSDGKFTGAVTYLGYPMFFKEDSLVKVAISTTGGHQTRETKCRGVQAGSHKSLVVLNEILFYKSVDGVCAYSGSVPYSVSDDFGEVRYTDGVAGSIDDSYYISLKGPDDKWNLFTYNMKTSIWMREDDTHAMAFCRHGDDLYYIDSATNLMWSVGGTELYKGKGTGPEGDFLWMVESGAIGYQLPDNKYVSRINVRLMLEYGARVDFWMQYDDGMWIHKFNMAGKGTRSFVIPVIPVRCDHFKYKLTGRGKCKIYSITKTMEQGSDL